MSNQEKNGKCYLEGYESGKANNAPSDPINVAITILGCNNTPDGKKATTKVILTLITIKTHSKIWILPKNDSIFNIQMEIKQFFFVL